MITCQRPALPPQFLCCSSQVVLASAFWLSHFTPSNWTMGFWIQHNKTKGCLWLTCLNVELYSHMWLCVSPLKFAYTPSNWTLQCVHRWQREWFLALWISHCQVSYGSTWSCLHHWALDWLRCNNRWWFGLDWFVLIEIGSLNGIASM